MPDGSSSAFVPQPRGLLEVVGTRLEPFLRGFQECSFQLEVEEFVEQHAEAFLVACPDGSQPLTWTALHQEYRGLFERQLDAILEELDIEREEFLEWLTALRGAAEHLEDGAWLPGSGGLSARDFDAFLAALTASEDYVWFRYVMFGAVAEQELKRRHQFLDAAALAETVGGRRAGGCAGGYAGGHAGGYTSGASADDARGYAKATWSHELEVSVPEDVSSGQVLAVDFLGKRYELLVPEGCGPGVTFRASVQVDVPSTLPRPTPPPLAPPPD